MSTLITLTLPNGTVHHCDESCYNSTDPECACICEGRNHGHGISQAERITMCENVEIIVAIAKHYPGFIQLSFHFHNTGLSLNLTRHEVLDAQHARSLEPSTDEQWQPRHLALPNPGHEHLKRTREHPTKATETDRDEPDR